MRSGSIEGSLFNRKWRFTLAPVEFAQAKLLLDHPAARLLRADQAAFALAFLHTAFKESGQTAVPEELLKTRLERWLAERREAHRDLVGRVA